MTDDLFITFRSGTTDVTYDAYDRYGISLEDGAVSALLAPVPMKELVSNKSRLRNGRKVLPHVPMWDERDLTLPFHITASNTAEFFTKYSLFCNEVLAKGRFTLRTKFDAQTYYRLVYQSCNQFAQLRQQIAVFVLRCTEPNPGNRGVTDSDSYTPIFPTYDIIDEEFV